MYICCLLIIFALHQKKQINMSQISTLRKTFFYVITLVTMSWMSPVFAQCPASITASVSTTAANCPSSGTATITSNADGISSTTYTLINGPSNATLNLPQSGNKFNALPAGNYTVKVACEAVSTNINFEIANNYSPITDISTTVTSTCGTGSFAPGGTITVNGVTGGSSPISYSIYKTTDANYDDALSNYGTVSSFTVDSYGVYQIRVKDNCNEYYTKTVEIQPALPPVFISWMDLDRNVANCAPGMFNIRYFELKSSVDQTFKAKEEYFNVGGFKLTLWNKDAGSCAPSGSPLFSQVITTHSFEIPEPAGLDYYIEIVTPCGDTSKFCYDVEKNPGLIANSSNVGCTGDPVNSPKQIVFGDIYRMNFPVTIEAIDATDGTTVVGSVTTSWTGYKIENLPLGNYIIRATDECGKTATTNVANPTNAGPLGIDYIEAMKWQCIGSEGLTQTGTSQMMIALNGYIPDLENAVVTIVSGPSNVGSIGRVDDTKSNVFFFTNMLPYSGNYILNVKTGCFDQDLPFTFNPPSDALLKQDISILAESYCGGTGTITATTNYNGPYNTTFQLVDVATGNVLAQNATGLFTNLSSGNYKVRLAIQNWCNSTPYYIESTDATIVGGSSAPVITKKIGVVCEDTSGNSTGTGTVYLTIAGASPKLEYKLSTDATWITHKESASANEIIGGLMPGLIYDFKVSSCGMTSQTQVSLGQLTAIHVSNTLQPCNGQPYTLSVPEYPGATYEWKNAAGVVVSNTRQYSIASYNNSYNGTYTATVLFGNCLMRVSNITVYGALCNQPIADVTVSGSVFHDVNNDGIVNGTKTGIAGTNNLYVSIIKNNTIITTVKVANDGTYTIPGIPVGNYDLVISGEALGSVVANLPNGWVSNGESLDATKDGKMSIAVGTTDFTGADFGIQQAPISYNVTHTISTAPVPGVPVALTGSPLQGSDPDGAPNTQSSWSAKSLIINTIATNNFILKYNGVEVTPNQRIDNYNPALLTIEPGASTPSGTSSTSFTYSVIDDLGAVSQAPATYIIDYAIGVPVVVNSFAVSQNSSCKVLVKWTVAVESNIKRYDIERSFDEKSFITLGSVNAKGNNATYEFEDESSIEGVNYYRLKIVENDGTVKYHTTAKITSVGACASSVSIYPTVTNGGITITGAAGSLVNVVSTHGQTVFTKQIDSNNERIDVSRLANGVYFITGNKSGKQFTLKFVKK